MAMRRAYKIHHPVPVDTFTIDNPEREHSVESGNIFRSFV